MPSVRIKTTYGKTWVGLEQEDFLTKDFMERLGGFLRDAIVFEGRKDLARQGMQPTPRGRPEGIPVSSSDAFFKSFHYEVKDNKIDIFSDWPWIDQILEGRKAYPMPWLTKERGVDKVPFPGSAKTVIIRSTPKYAREAWIHPGFRKHNFVRRGYEKARKKFEEELEKRVLEVLRKTPIV